jgi:hypothetical protein
LRQGNTEADIFISSSAIKYLLVEETLLAAMIIVVKGKTAFTL